MAGATGEPLLPLLRPGTEVIRFALIVLVSVGVCGGWEGGGRGPVEEEGVCRCLLGPAPRDVRPRKLATHPRQRKAGYVETP